MPVELIDVGAEVDTPTEEPLDGGPSEAAAVADEELTLVAADIWSVDVLLVDVLLVDVLSVDDFAGGSSPTNPNLSPPTPAPVLWQQRFRPPMRPLTRRRGRCIWPFP